MGFKVLPKINLELKNASEEMLQTLIEWAKLGFNGFRIDHALGIPDKFLIQLGEETKKIDPEFVLIGEVWGEGMKYKYLKTIRLKRRYSLWKKGFNQVQLQKSYEGILDGVFDFGWTNLVLNNLNLIKKRKKSLENKIEQYNNQYQNKISLVRFLDNHDMDRIMFLCNEDEELFKEVVELLYIQKTPISIYYGTEAGMSQASPISTKIPFSDLHARQCMIWNNQANHFNYLKDLAEKRIK
jgi:cyclomaltodextrinase / maltogenic alpha-amylase / neopullulanase